MFEHTFLEAPQFAKCWQVSYKQDEKYAKQYVSLDASDREKKKDNGLLRPLLKAYLVP